MYEELASQKVLFHCCFMFCYFLLQVKFSELTLDMFRMLQTLEREPQEDLTNQIYDASPAPGRQPFVCITVYLLLRISALGLGQVARVSSYLGPVIQN